MNPTRILMDEHQTILRVLASLEKLVTGGTCATTPVQTFREVVDFLRTYADRLHHGKEEALLFPVMERCGLPSTHGPTAVMRDEHDEGRALVRRMAAACESAEFDCKAFREPALEFVALLRSHIAKEDHILFPMAERLIDPKTGAALAESYARAEERDFDPDVHARYENWARELAHSLDIHDERFEVTPSCHG